MIELTLMGEKIFICTRDEAKNLWQKSKSKRHQIWLQDEVKAAMLLGPKEIRDIIQKKKSRQGYVYSG